MDVRLLGPVKATLDGRPLALGATKQRAVLAILALQVNATVPVDQIIDGLWGERPPRTATKMVQLYVSQLRRLLLGTDAQIITHGRGYELRLGQGCVDAERFEGLVERAMKCDAGGVAAHAAHAALALWHDAPLADVAGEPFAAAEIRRLDELRLRAAELAVDDDLAAGRDDRALARLERLVEAHPLRERLHEQRMLALYRAGRQAEALAAYRAARRRLVAEVGVEPGVGLQSLHARVLQHDPGLLPARPAARGRAGLRDARPPAAGRRPRPGREPPAMPRATLTAAGAVGVAVAIALGGRRRSSRS